MLAEFLRLALHLYLLKDNNNINIMPASKSKCVKQTQKKYTTRSSPPFPANECKNQTKKGNNGKFFKSVVDKNGVFKWIALKITNKSISDLDWNLTVEVSQHLGNNTLHPKYPIQTAF